MLGSYTWTCPRLCGCLLNIDADWAKAPSVVDGASLQYQYPVPNTVKSINIVVVCPAHAHFVTDAPIADETYGGEMRGYLWRPPVTDGEKLFVALTRYAGQRFKPDTCGCRIFECVDRVTKLKTVHPHPTHTRRCAAHRLDDDAHTAAYENWRRKNTVVGLVLRASAGVTEEVGWRYDAARVLHIQAPVTLLDIPTVMATVESVVGKNKVVIER